MDLLKIKKEKKRKEDEEKNKILDGGSSPLDTMDMRSHG